MSIPGKSFFIVTPCDDGHRLCFWDSVRAFERAFYSGKLDTPHRFYFHCVQGDSLVSRGRNNILHYFRQSTDFDAMFAIDSDLDFTVENILRLADVFAARDLDFVAGRYAIKEPTLRWCENRLPGAEPDADGIMEIAMAPGGVHIISRRAIDRMIASAPGWGAWRIQYTDDMMQDERWNLYFNGVVIDTEFFPDRPLGRYLSEDWGISYLARKLGIRIWCDTKTVMFHEGAIKYPIQARRLTAQEVAAGAIVQPDGTQTSIAPPEKV
tara:strand:- start:772 stop:1572 length:801 start_codon:yes stop_codon:yes gene_type:complete